MSCPVSISHIFDVCTFWYGEVYQHNILSLLFCPVWWLTCTVSLQSVPDIAVEIVVASQQ